jgi:WhiB family redox-sensing transcriptional regulator
MSAAICPPEWTERALCTEVFPDLFFPEHGIPAGPATSICRGCKVRLDCLKDAMQRPSELGVWGGFSERVRQRIGRRHAAGTLLEDIIAEDDARYYARIEKAAERVSYKDRQLATAREQRRLRRQAA